MADPWRRDLTEWANQQAVHTACGHCDWTFDGTLAEGREAHADHRHTAHGIPKAHRRFHRHRTPWGRTSDAQENIAAARLTGAAGWASDDPEWRAA